MTVDATCRTNKLWDNIRRGRRTFAILSDGEPKEMRAIKKGAVMRFWNKAQTKWVGKRVAETERFTVNGEECILAWLETGQVDADEEVDE